VPLGSESNRRPAARTRSATATMHGMPLPGDWRHEVAAHQVAGRYIELVKAVVIQLGGTHPRVQPKRPQRLALIDVADAGANTLLQQ